jgi:hypothetical protein
VALVPPVVVRARVAVRVRGGDRATGQHEELTPRVIARHL